MPDQGNEPDARLLALARALGRYQARLHAAERNAECSDRTSDFGDEQVFVTTPKAAEGIENDDAGMGCARTAPLSMLVDIH